MSSSQLSPGRSPDTRRRRHQSEYSSSMASSLLLLPAVALLLLSAFSGPTFAQMCSDVPMEHYTNSSGLFAIPYDTTQGWYKNRTTWYWDFGPRSAAAGPANAKGSIVLAAPIWVPYYANGTKAGNNIIDVVPCEADGKYSDLWIVHKVTIPDTYPLNFFKDAATVQQAITLKTVPEEVPGLMVNCPVVPFNSTINDTHSTNPNVTASLPNPVFGWYKGKAIFYFDFGPVLTNVTQPVWAVMTQSGAKGGQNFIDVVQGDPGYTPFWQLVIVTVPDSLGNNMTRSRQVAAPYPMNMTGLIVNCPVAYTTPDPNAAPPSTTASSIAPCTVSFMGQSMDFDKCITLDANGKFALAWRPKGPSSPGIFEVLYTGTPDRPYGWGAWGISPTGLMPNTDAIVGYGGGAANAAEAPGIGLYHMNTYSPTQVPLQNGGPSTLLLKPAADSLKVAFTNGGMTVMTLADVSGLTGGEVIVVWKGGPSADVSTGALVPHFDTSRASRKFDFVKGTAEGVDTTTSNENQKIAHAFLAAIGFGLLMPCGILIARHLKVWADPLWYYAHIGVQVTGYLVGVSGWSIGVWLKQQYGDLSLAPSYQQAHFGIGIAIFCSATLQILTPVLKPDKKAPVRLYWNLGHWGLGYSTVILSIVNIFLGFSILGEEYINYGGWRTAYIVLISVWGGLLVLLEPLSWYMFNKKKVEEEKAMLPENNTGGV